MHTPKFAFLWAPSKHISKQYCSQPALPVVEAVKEKKRYLLFSNCDLPLHLAV